MMKIPHITCPQCKTRIPKTCKSCWFCDMPFEDMLVSFTCEACNMRFIANFDIDGNTCQRSSCGSKKVVVRYKVQWSDDEEEILRKYKDIGIEKLAKKLKRPIEGVKRKYYRMKQEWGQG